ncbi:MAG: hypothetical protein ABSB50_14385 [Terracidiphilus sp.]|jgi:hypothetical protein
MGRTLIRSALVLLLLSALLAPVLETFDRWDAVPGLANDTEFRAAALAVAAGLLAAVAVVAARTRISFDLLIGLQLSSAAAPMHLVPPSSLLSGSSPPVLTLRI